MKGFELNINGEELRKYYQLKKELESEGLI